MHEKLAKNAPFAISKKRDLVPIMQNDAPTVSFSKMKKLLDIPLFLFETWPFLKLLKNSTYVFL